MTFSYFSFDFSYIAAFNPADLDLSSNSIWCETSGLTTKSYLLELMKPGNMKIMLFPDPVELT
jgi:hypothetical protein